MECRIDDVTCETTNYSTCKAAEQSLGNSGNSRLTPVMGVATIRTAKTSNGTADSGATKRSGPRVHVLDASGCLGACTGCRTRNTGKRTSGPCRYKMLGDTPARLDSFLGVRNYFGGHKSGSV